MTRPAALSLVCVVNAVPWAFLLFLALLGTLPLGLFRSECLRPGYFGVMPLSFLLVLIHPVLLRVSIFFVAVFWLGFLGMLFAV